MRARKFTRHERKLNRQNKLRTSLAGTGMFIYENNTSGDLTLPKPTASGQRKVGPKQQFQGDSYYQSWCKPPMNLLRFISTVVPVVAEKIENNLMEANMPDKLILDQPDTITQHGKVEHLVETPKVETQKPAITGTSETLLTEDPLEGVEIILG
jgi:hypothetical protein